MQHDRQLISMEFGTKKTVDRVKVDALADIPGFGLKIKTNIALSDSACPIETDGRIDFNGILDKK